MNNYFKIIKKYVLFFIVLSLTSCLTNVEDEVEIDPCLDITFSVSVKPIIDAHCVQCHGNGGKKITPHAKRYHHRQDFSGRV